MDTGADLRIVATLEIFITAVGADDGVKPVVQATVQQRVKCADRYRGYLLGFLHIEALILDWGQEEKGTTEDKMAGWHH